MYNINGLRKLIPQEMIMKSIIPKIKLISNNSIQTAQQKKEKQVLPRSKIIENITENQRYWTVATEVCLEQEKSTFSLTVSWFNILPIVTPPSGPICRCDEWWPGGGQSPVWGT